MIQSNKSICLPEFNSDNITAKRLLDITKSLAEKGEYLLAIITMYRWMEIAAENYLNSYAPFSHWDAGIYIDIKEKFRFVRQKLINYNKGEEASSELGNLPLPNRFGFTSMLIVCHIINKKQLPYTQLKNVIQLAEIRHSTWLTHGMEVPTKKDYEKMAKVYIPLIKKLCIDINRKT